MAKYQNSERTLCDYAEVTGIDDWGVEFQIRNRDRYPSARVRYDFDTCPSPVQLRKLHELLIGNRVSTVVSPDLLFHTVFYALCDLTFYVISLSGSGDCLSYSVCANSPSGERLFAE